MQSQKALTLDQKLQFLIAFSAEISPKLSENVADEQLTLLTDEEVDKVCQAGLDAMQPIGEEFFQKKKELHEAYRKTGKMEPAIVQTIEAAKSRFAFLTLAVDT